MAEDRESERPDRSSRPKRPQGSGRSGRPARPGQPGKPGQPGQARSTGKPAGGSRPTKRNPRYGEQKRERDNHRDRGPRPSGTGRGGTRGGGRSDRGGAAREFTEAERMQHALRPVRSEHTDPEIPDTVTAKDLNPGARNELKTLDKDLADLVARHLAAVSILIDSDPELAHQHAISASRRAGRIPVVRETLAITSYILGDYAGALRELRTYRRLSGSENQLAMMIDCERGLGRPEKALETGRSVPREKLPADVQVQVAIAMSGARLDLGQTQQALFELEIPQLDPTKAFSYSPELFGCYANVLEDLGRDQDAQLWRKRAEQAEAALDDEFGSNDTIEVVEIDAPSDVPGEGSAV